MALLEPISLDRQDSEPLEHIATDIGNPDQLL
jgi:hypothetical protein